MSAASKIDPDLHSKASALTRELLGLVTVRTEISPVAMDALASALMNVAQAAGVLHEIPRIVRAMAEHPAVVEACAAKQGEPSTAGTDHGTATHPPQEGAPVPTPEQIEEVRQLSEEFRELAHTATSPAAGLNALLSAYLNTAADAGVLDQVPGAGQALGEASRAMQAHKASAAQAAHSNLH